MENEQKKDLKQIDGVGTVISLIILSPLLFFLSPVFSLLFALAFILYKVLKRFTDIKTPRLDKHANKLTILFVVLVLVAIPRLMSQNNDYHQKLKDSKHDFENTKEQLEESEDNVLVLTEENKVLKSENEEMKSELNSEAYLVYKAKADEELAKEAEQLARKQEEERLVQEKKEQEEKLAQEKAEREKYERTISYAELKKNPDKYAGEPYKFTGEVVQIMEGDLHTVIRLSVTKASYGWSMNDIVYIEYIGLTDVVDGDIVTVYGDVFGSHTYTSQAGYNITLPAVEAKQIVKK